MLTCTMPLLLKPALMSQHPVIDGHLPYKCSMMWSESLSCCQWSAVCCPCCGARVQQLNHSAWGQRWPYKACRGEDALFSVMALLPLMHKGCGCGLSYGWGLQRADGMCPVRRVQVENCAQP